MDALINAAGRALAVGDVLGALNRVALREDPPALAVRGIAMAQLGELDRARALLRRARRAFGEREVLARARCSVAEAEVALAQRDLRPGDAGLDAAIVALDALGDRSNALQGRLIAIRRQLLLGRIAAATEALGALRLEGAPASLRAIAALLRAETALRRLQTDAAAALISDAATAAAASRIPALVAEVAGLGETLVQPAARCIGQTAALTLPQVEALLGSDTLVVDACRHALRRAGRQLSLARRPVLFALLRSLGAAWPEDCARDALIAQAFRQRIPDETHRARLRVEIGRLRRLIRPLAELEATVQGYRLVPRDGVGVSVIEPPHTGQAGAVLALLADGAAWSTSALALALGDSQRTVQRTLVELQAQARVRAIGRARAQRWLLPSRAGFTTILLLPTVPGAG